MRTLKNKRFVNLVNLYFLSKGKKKILIKKKLDNLSKEIKKNYILKSDLYIIFKKIIPIKTKI